MIVLSEISELDDKCLDAPAASSAIKPSGSLDLLASGLHDQDSTCITDAQKKCIQVKFYCRKEKKQHSFA